ncbi:MerR family transcriptional regulator [Hydrogenibacillus sp. N12]|uniref:MerR family transcriptional regulator n=1 Tax=Hydrogenibacillus sp. N12 TaxID=2866627 RepID=UPI001C7CDC91|nr:MerR family transcriptional regulator [Hydrogenibacillus sp. N12]QZA32996.1 MerR family transcriptional regulator [Hydrogenibacillus sp. N12]
MAEEKALSIGALAAQTGVSRDAIRLYEAEGLLRPLGRTPAGYRQFAPEAVDRVRLIRTLQALGFTLKEIGRFMAIVDRDAARCDRIGDFIRAKREEVARKIAALRQLEALLADLDRRCPHLDDLFACPVVDHLRWTAVALAGEGGRSADAAGARPGNPV